jgi:hypothetical protein
MLTVCYEAAVRHTSWSRFALIALQAAVIYVTQVSGFSLCILPNVHAAL